MKTLLTFCTASLLLTSVNACAVSNTPIEDIRAMYPNKQVERLLINEDLFLVTSNIEGDSWSHVLSDLTLIALRKSGENIYRIKPLATYGNELQNDIAMLQRLADNADVEWAFGNCNPNDAEPWLSLICLNLDLPVSAHHPEHAPAGTPTEEHISSEHTSSEHLLEDVR